MPLVNLNAVAAASCRSLQAAIAKLDALKQQPDGDAARIDAEIGTLQARQAELRDRALYTIESSSANQDAVAAMRAAASRLNAEATALQVTTTDLAGVAKIVEAAGSVIAALARLA